jgi:hypothetical protein
MSNAPEDPNAFYRRATNDRELHHSFKKRFVVLLVDRNFLPRTSTVHYVIDGSGVLNTKRQRHKTVRTIADRQLSTKDLTASIFHCASDAVKESPDHR